MQRQYANPIPCRRSTPIYQHAFYYVTRLAQPASITLVIVVVCVDGQQ